MRQRLGLGLPPGPSNTATATTEEEPSETAPAQFGTGDWSLTDLGTGTSARITITALPDDGGSAITDLEYQIDDGSWVSLEDTATGDYDLTGLTWHVEIDVSLRAVNAIGNGTASAAKSVTPLVSFASVLALNPELAFSAVESGSSFQERTGASATTPSGANDVVGSFKNFGTLGGWLVAPTDGKRGIMRHAGSLRYIEGDGVDDILIGSLSALRDAAGFALVAGVKNTGSTAVARVPAIVYAGNGTTRAGFTFAVTTGNARLTARRLNADTAANLDGSDHANTDVVATGLGDYTNTTGTIRVNGTQEGQNTSWLSSGNTPNDQGAVSILGLDSNGSTFNMFIGPVYSFLTFRAVLSGPSLTLAERWTAQQSGVLL